MKAVVDCQNSNSDLPRTGNQMRQSMLYCENGEAIVRIDLSDGRCQFPQNRVRIPVELRVCHCLQRAWQPLQPMRSAPIALCLAKHLGERTRLGI